MELDSVRLAEPEPVNEFGLRITFRPGVLAVDNETEPVNPLIELTVIVETPWLPAFTVTLAGLAARLKSTTLTLIVAVWTSVPLVAVMVTEY